MRPLLIAALAGLAAPGASLAEDAPPAADPDALEDFAPLRIATIDLAAGLAVGLDSGASGADLRAGVLGAAVDLLGLRARVLRLEVVGRPSLGSVAVGGGLLTVDAWMVGASNVDDRPCLWWPEVQCDGSTGFLGFGGSLLGFAHETSSGRSALRILELAVLASPTPAFGASWNRFRFLPRAGASLDVLWRVPSGGDGVYPRLSVGFDAGLRLGLVEIEPSLRWRPSLRSFTGDWGLEASLRIMLRGRWDGLSPPGSPLRLWVELGYQYWSAPGTAFAVDQLPGAAHTGVLRLVVAPTLFSIVSP